MFGLPFLQHSANGDVVGLADNPQIQCSGSLGGHAMPHCPGIVVVVKVLLHTARHVWSYMLLGLILLCNF